MLKLGLYEQVISKELGRDLDADTDKLKSTALIDGAEASKILAKYIAEVIEKGLDIVKDCGGDLQTQVSLANKIVSIIANETGEFAIDTLSVDERAEQLLALLDKKNSIFALNPKEPIPRPETSIAQSSLFTGAIHESTLETEFKTERRLFPWGAEGR